MKDLTIGYSLFLKIYFKNFLYRDILLTVGIYFLSKTDFFRLYLLFLAIVIFVNQLRFLNKFKEMMVLNRINQSRKQFLIPVFYAFTDLFLMSILLSFKMEYFFIFMTITLYSFFINLFRTIIL